MRDGSARLSPTVRRVSLVALSLIAALGVVLIASLIPPDSTTASNDFGQEYLLARAILDGVDPYQPVQDLAARYATVSGYFVKSHPTPHPPTVGLMALPLGLVSYPVAARIWFGIELICLVGAVGLLVRAARLPLRNRLVPVLAFALVAWPPVVLELSLGQLMLPLLLGLAAAQMALLGGRSRLGGGLLGLTLLIKPIAWPWLLVLAWRRDRRALVSAVGVVAVGGMLSVLTIGAERCANYLFVVLPMVTSGFLLEPTNLSLWTVAPRLGSVTTSWLLPSVALVTSTWWAWRRLPLEAGLALMTVVSLLVSPITWYFYVILALLPLAYGLRAVLYRGLRPGDVIALVGVFVLLGVSQARLTELVAGIAGSGVLLEPALALVVLGALIISLNRGILLRGRFQDAGRASEDDATPPNAE